MSEHGFATMRKSVRSHAIELSENIVAIASMASNAERTTAAKAGKAQHNVLQWRRETGQTQSKRMLSGGQVCLVFAAKN
jgi:hypothetical protein